MNGLLDQFPIAIGVFFLATVIIVVAGTRMAKAADELADRTGLGEAVTGVFILGASTSLPGLVASISAAIDGKPSMAVSNAVGGIAVQTVFLVIADMFSRRANLEHMAASLSNLFQGALLMTLLSLALVAGMHPFAETWAIHPVTPLLILMFLAGQRIAGKIENVPMWEPVETKDTRLDIPDEHARQIPLRRLLGKFLILAAATGAGGWLIAEAGFVLVEQTALDEGSVGALLTAVASSLPELVTSIAAVRNGAFTLAISGIVGGNAFDTLFLAASDVAYREGSIYHAAAPQDNFLMGITLIMTAVLTGGLIARQRSGPGNIGWEGILILGLYLLTVAVRFL